MKEKYIRRIGIPLLALLLSLFYHNQSPYKDQFLFVTCFLVSLAFTFCLWEGNRAIVMRMRKVFPTYAQTSRRIVSQSILGLIYTTLIALVLPQLIQQVVGMNLFEQQSQLALFLVCLIPTVSISAIYESAFFFESWKRDVHRSEVLARENLVSQFEALKSQVDPHFLFNSLNTLAALIDETNEPALKYLDQLSDVYRYVLLSKDRPTVPLQEELAFLDAYLYLNKTRFRENLLIQNELSPAYSQHHVAPLSLQMLVENAIKHNVVSKEKPLCIRLFHERPDTITVQNNVQGKTVFEKSTKVGLQNIINRYKFLNGRQIEILHQDGLFTVRLPLLPSAILAV
jgi:LytS/YehU family sensor histidine kinase